MHLSHFSKSFKNSVEVENERLFFTTSYKEPFPFPHTCGVSNVQSVGAVSLCFDFVSISMLTSAL